jgi:phosphatidylserine/phosphatidylglycerophosphate/cardiolipin synthase-like enzyme
MAVTYVSEKYPLARSLCEAVGWDPSPLASSLRGVRITEIDDRCRELGIRDDLKRELLCVALYLATAVAERERSEFRILASKPKLVEQAGRVWAIGQEWLELIRGATRRIVIVSPSLDELAAANLGPALSAAFRAGTGLTVVHGALGNVERLRSALRTFIEAFPNAVLLRWPTELGFLHAKLICIDDISIYLGSANITEYGWHKNVEVGITISGQGAVPLIRYCNGLVVLASEHAVAPGRLNNSDASPPD